jgi:hypothetical protein
LQLRASHESQLSSTTSRLGEALRRADGLQSRVDELHAKCKHLYAELQAAKHATEEMEKVSAAREAAAKQQAEVEASHMYRQLNSQHGNAIQALQQRLKDEVASAAAEREALETARLELDSCRASHAAVIAEKDRMIASHEFKLSDAEARLQSYKQRVEDESTAASSFHTQALRVQEAAHAASVEALQATYDMQLRQLRATSQGAIESVGKSQDALTLVCADSDFCFFN